MILSFRRFTLLEIPVGDQTLPELFLNLNLLQSSGASLLTG
jgi:hypothetical protein